MKIVGTVFLTLFSLYLLLYFKVIPYRLVSIATLDSMQAQIDQASATPPPTPTPSPTPAPALKPTPAQAPTVAAVPGQPVVATQLIADYHGALLLVEGQKGVGTGFLCNMDGHTYAVTNAHVLADNVGVKLTSLNGTVFTAGASAVAVGHDVVKMEVASAPKAFEVMSKLDANVKVGDGVIVLGNEEGGGVVRPCEGKIVGIGPDLVEVDAPFVKGNSGSPIIHAATGKVIGIATYIVNRKVTPGSGEVALGERHFGYRLDNIQSWESINWQVFFAQAAEVAQIESLSDDFVRMSQDVNSSDHRFVPSNYSSPALQHAINSFLQDASRNGISKSDKLDLLQGLFAQLRTVSRSDITAFKAHPAYDYFRRDVDDQSRFRDELYDGFSRAMDSFEH